MAGAFQAWVKPEVDPPRVCALPREACNGRAFVSHGPKFSRAAASVRADWTRGVMGAGRRKHIADGPEGAASRGASKAKVAPPRGDALRREGGDLTGLEVASPDREV